MKYFYNSSFIHSFDKNNIFNPFKNFSTDNLEMNLSMYRRIKKKKIIIKSQTRSEMHFMHMHLRRMHKMHSIPDTNSNFP